MLDVQKLVYSRHITFKLAKLLYVVEVLKDSRSRCAFSDFSKFLLYVVEGLLRHHCVIPLISGNW